MPIQPYPAYQPWQGQYSTQFPAYQVPQVAQPYQQLTVSAVGTL